MEHRKMWVTAQAKQLHANAIHLWSLTRTSIHTHLEMFGVWFYQFLYQEQTNVCVLIPLMRMRYTHKNIYPHPPWHVWSLILEVSLPRADKRLCPDPSHAPVLCSPDLCRMHVWYIDCSKCCNLSMLENESWTVHQLYTTPWCNPVKTKALFFRG